MGTATIQHRRHVWPALNLFTTVAATVIATSALVVAVRADDNLVLAPAAVDVTDDVTKTGPIVAEDPPQVAREVSSTRTGGPLVYGCDRHAGTNRC